MRNDPLDGKVTIVTGSARGLGMAIAEGYLQAGATVAMVDRDSAGLEAAAAELSTAERRPLPIVADIRFEEQIDQVVRSLVDQFGRIDVLVNNAAVLMRFVTRDAPERPRFWEIDPAHWRELWEINMTGTWLFARRAAREMMRVRRGSIVNITTSPHTMVSQVHIPYGPSKAGIDAFTQAAAKQLAPHGVRMNALYPGDTEARTPGTPGSTRRGRPVLVPAAIFLASDASAEISGQSISAYRFYQEHELK
jgi:NAD(P)-dependent dehydrogenase (short-subunit alcohol dehydrogenase family)